MFSEYSSSSGIGSETHILSLSPSNRTTLGPGARRTGGPLLTVFGRASGGLGSLDRAGGGSFIGIRLGRGGGAGILGSQDGGGPGGGGGGTPAAIGNCPCGLGCGGCLGCSAQTDLPCAGGGGRYLSIIWAARGSELRMSRTASWTSS